MKYKLQFSNLIKNMDSDFNWTTKYDSKLIKELINNEITGKHKLYNKTIKPISICKNKYDLLGYYKENNKDIFITIHFVGYKSSDENSPYYEEYESLESAIIKIVDVYNKLYKQSRYDMLIESEGIKRQKSYFALQGLYSKMPIIYDCLLKINEFRGQVATKDNENLIIIQDLFQFFSYDFVYKIRSIFLLCEIENYADAAIILRSLTEAFFYFKYYIIKNDGKKLYEYVNQSKKRGTKIKDIMDNIAPSYYDSIYNDLCKLSHSNPLITGLFRGNVSKENKLRHSMYNINIDWFSYILNLTLPLINGYFSMFKIVYKNNTIETSEQLSNNIKLIQNFINKDLEDRYKIYEKQRKTIDLYKKIITF